MMAQIHSPSLSARFDRRTSNQAALHRRDIPYDCSEAQRLLKPASAACIARPASPTTVFNTFRDDAYTLSHFVLHLSYLSNGNGPGREPPFPLKSPRWFSLCTGQPMRPRITSSVGQQVCRPGQPLLTARREFWLDAPIQYFTIPLPLPGTLLSSFLSSLPSLFVPCSRPFMFLLCSLQKAGDLVKNSRHAAGSTIES